MCINYYAGSAVLPSPRQSHVHPGLSIPNYDCAHSCCSGNKLDTISNIRRHASRSDTVETCVARNQSDVMAQTIVFIVCGLFDFRMYSIELFLFKMWPTWLSVIRPIVKSLSFSPPAPPSPPLSLSPALAISRKGCVVSSPEILQLTCKWTM